MIYSRLLRPSTLFEIHNDIDQHRANCHGACDNISQIKMDIEKSHCVLSKIFQNKCLKNKTFR